MSASYEAATRLLQQLDIPEGVVHPDYIDFDSIICDRNYSSGEWTLVLAAQDLFNSGGNCTLRQLLDNLDDVNYAAVCEAMRLRRPGAFTTNLVAN